ncbi:hypothetical protein V5F89_12440 [Pelagerythrobacter marensis]|uniref:Phage gp6-like head-tail connector protein n=1 Tax=Pelagerythrobacter marensis TaxID=543877 RepID=A0ABZ2D6T2_9SPHN
MGWAAPIAVVPPAAEPVSVAEAKEFLSIGADEPDFDVLLASFIAAAREQLEAVTSTRLAEQTLQLHADGFADLRRLPLGPVQAVSEIVYDDAAGAEQVLASGDYELFGAGLEQGVRPAFGKTWPAGALRASAVRVTAAVGYEQLPRPLWAAILLMTGDLFANRETTSSTTSTKIPMSMQVEALITNYRIWL